MQQIIILNATDYHCFGKGDCIPRLEKQINSYLNDGWQLQGSVSISVAYIPATQCTHSSMVITATQMMIREKPEYSTDSITRSDVEPRQSISDPM